MVGRGSSFHGSFWGGIGPKSVRFNVFFSCNDSRRERGTGVCEYFCRTCAEGSNTSDMIAYTWRCISYQAQKLKVSTCLLRSRGIIFMKLKNNSCEFKDFAETRLRNLCVTLRSRLLRVLYGFMQHTHSVC